MDSVLGLVLCGGESRRMGRDKALLDLAGTSLIRRAVGTVESLADEVVLGTGEAGRYGELGLACVLDSVPGVGPLAGLCAGLAAASEGGHEWLLVLACDTPRLDTELFRVLLLEARGQDVDACLYRSPTGLEPLCAVYRVSCLKPVQAALASGERRLRSFHSDLRVAFLTDEQLPKILRDVDLSFNVNTPVELEEERARLAKGSSGGGAMSNRHRRTQGQQEAEALGHP